MKNVDFQWKSLISSNESFPIFPEYWLSIPRNGTSDICREIPSTKPKINLLTVSSYSAKGMSMKSDKNFSNNVFKEKDTPFDEIGYTHGYY